MQHTQDFNKFTDREMFMNDYINSLEAENKYLRDTLNRIYNNSIGGERQ